MSFHNSNSTLNDVRRLARAKALEDFEYFSNYVLGVRLDAATCFAAQKAVERGEEVRLPSKSYEAALRSWLYIVRRQGELCNAHKTDTFSWLFGEIAA